MVAEPISWKRVNLRMAAHQRGEVVQANTDQVVI
jgi:hypothetical protein